MCGQVLAAVMSNNDLAVVQAKEADLWEPTTEAELDHMEAEGIQQAQIQPQAVALDGPVANGAIIRQCCVKRYTMRHTQQCLDGFVCFQLASECRSVIPAALQPFSKISSECKGNVMSTSRGWHVGIQSFCHARVC